MAAFEYKAVPAPTQGAKARGLKATEDRFALAVTEVLNQMAEEGWDYVRAETLPCDERKGLTGTQTNFQNLLIFRRRALGDLRGADQALPPLQLGAKQDGALDPAPAPTAGDRVEPPVTASGERQS
ncbi:MAG: DUF4177 domain-containing protein [Paracoccaceae bacterium]|nr:DUF4177 domain-containing protein [Paracoccaceae bacterium]